MPAEAAVLPKVGFAVSSRNFKRAVDRNRVKRLGREAYRLNKATLLQAANTRGLSLEIFFVFTPKTLPTFALVENGIQGCLGRLIAKLNMEK